MGTKVLIGAVLLLAQCTGTVSAQTDRQESQRTIRSMTCREFSRSAPSSRALDGRRGASLPSNRTRLTARAKLRRPERHRSNRANQLGEPWRSWFITSGQPQGSPGLTSPETATSKGVVVPRVLPAGWRDSRSRTVSAGDRFRPPTLASEPSDVEGEKRVEDSLRS